MLAEKYLDLPIAIQLATASETASRDAMELAQARTCFESTIVNDLAVSHSGAVSLACNYGGVLPLWSHWSSPARLPLQRNGMPCMWQEGAHFSRLSTEKSDGAKKMPATHAVEETSEDDDVFALHFCATAETHKIKSSRTTPIWIHPKVNGCQLQMELDMGSALTILPASMFHEHFHLPLQPTSTI